MTEEWRPPLDPDSDLRDQILEALCDPEAADAVMHVVEPAMLAVQVDAAQRADLLAGRLQEAEADRSNLAQRYTALDKTLIAERQGRLAAEASVRRLSALVESYPPGSRFARSGAQALFRRTLNAEQAADPG